MNVGTLRGSPVCSQQPTKPFGRFDLCVDIRLSLNRYDRFDVESWMVASGVIVHSIQIQLRAQVAPATAITWSRSSKTSRVKDWPLTISAFDRSSRLGCIDRRVERAVVRRVGEKDVKKT